MLEIDLHNVFCMFAVCKDRDFQHQKKKLYNSIWIFALVQNRCLHQKKSNQHRMFFGEIEARFDTSDSALALCDLYSWAQKVQVTHCLD